jgi:uncharacterized integral membrane protein (TIGR00698 family)
MREQEDPAPAVVTDSPLPGLLAVAVATGLAMGIGHLVPALNASTAAVVLGAVLVNVGWHHPRLHAGTRVASHALLRIAVVLLGLQLAVRELIDLGAAGLGVVAVTVAITFAGTRWVGRLLGLPPARSLLIATWFSICGASAVAAMKEVADGDEDDAAVAIALVTVFGTLAIVVLPALRGPLGLNPAEFGSWAGASVHDVGQTVATADRVDGALAAAVVVKLARVVLLAPLVAGVAIGRSRRRGADSAGRRPPVVPLFVAGFLTAIVVGSTGWLPPAVLSLAATAQEVLLVAALVGLGAGVRLSLLKRTGGPALVLGLTSWLLVTSVAYAGVVVLGR